MMNESERPTVHHTELPPAQPGEALAEEWESYRREVARLLAEGHEGRFVLVKGQQIVAAHDHRDAARADGLRRYFPEAFLVQQVCAVEPVLRIRGYTLPCRH